ncbi:hypothetical protein NP233_g1357 [Leucocoprinus birnbaumii]|uniref:Uncharacterized protein n=1 Tax=Leucocoprinus birnbaumii TaxID=56174 RepID=A0AAD5YZM2_9AGAR|nr:hypothetical protein NP233_g1357 [Leucocoprinus birnbaumii]
MARSFNSFSTPSVPPPPHTTPSTAQQLLKPKLPRPPIHNPFDKFNQNDFDAWIGKLTGDLEKALGYDEVAPPREDDAVPASGVVAEPTQEFDESYLEGDVEDSFAEVKARRVSKGKARDPREGPGLGPKAGEQDQPIEILSDDEEDERGSSQVLGSDGSVDEEGEEEYDEEGEEYEEEGEEEQEEVGTSARVWTRKGGEETDEEEYYEEYDEEDGEAAVASREGSADVIELLSDTEPAPRVVSKHRQHEEEDQFLSDEDEPVDTRSSPAQYENEDEDEDEHMRSSPVQYDEQGDEEEIQPSDQDTSFPPHSHLNKGQSHTTAETLVDIHDPWERVERYAQDYYAGGELTVPPRSNKKGLLAAHYLGVKDDDSATGFLSPDVVSHADFENEEEERDVDEKEKEGDEDIYDEDEEGEEGDYEDYIDEDPKENAEEEVDEGDHLFNRLHSSFTTRPFGMPYSQTHQPLIIDKSGPGTNDEPIMIDSDEEEEAPAPAPVAQRQPERDYHAEAKERVTEKHFDQETQDEDEEHGETRAEGEDFLDELVAEIHAENQRAKVDEFETGDQIAEETPEPVALELGVEEPKPSEESPAFNRDADAHPNEAEQFRGHLHEEDVPTQPVPDAQQVFAEELLSLSRDLPTSILDHSQFIQPQPQENIMDWATLNTPDTIALDPQLPGVADTLAVPISGTIPLPGLVGANVDAPVFGFASSFDLDFAVGAASNQQTAVHETHTHTVVEDEDRGASEVAIAHEMHTHTVLEDESRAASAVDEQEVIDVDAEVDELANEEDEPATFVPLMTSDLEYPENEEEEHDELQGSTPSPAEATTVEAPIQPEVATEGQDEKGEGSDREPEVQIFVEEPEEYWEGTPPAEITINIQAATPVPPSPIIPMEDKFEQTPASPPQTLETVDRVDEGDEEVGADAIPGPAPLPISLEGAIEENAIVVEEEEQEHPTIIVEEPVTESASTKEHQVLENDATDITITALDAMESTYEIEEPLTASEYHASEGPSRAVSLGIMSVRSDEVIPATGIAIGDVEEMISDVEITPEVAADRESSRLAFSFDDGGDLEAQFIPVETQFELITETGTESTAVVTDVTNAQWPLRLDDELSQVRIEEISSGNEAQTVIEDTADDVHALSHTHTSSGTVEPVPVPSTFTEDNADGYFAQPGSPVMDFYGSTDFSKSPSAGLPTIIQLPGTPQKVLTPGGTPNSGPMPVAIAVDPVVLRALKSNPALFSPPTIPTSLESHRGSVTSRSVSVEVASENKTPPSGLELTTEAAVETTPSVLLSPDISPLPFDEVQAKEEAPTVQNEGPSLQTAFLATTVPGKPTLPTLFEDPYPYSLSTPGPQNEVEGSEEEESTEQENSISTTSSTSASSGEGGAAAAENAEEETDKISTAAAAEEVPEVLSKDAVNVEVHPSLTEITVPTESVVVSSTSEEVNEVLQMVEKGLADVEAEADKLISEFLVDEPDTDTDADGEADPEFVPSPPEAEIDVDASEEIVIEEMNDQEASPRGADMPALSVEGIVEEVEQPTSQEVQEVVENVPQESEEQKAEEIGDAKTEEGEMKNQKLVTEADDPFKLMGNDSLVAPGEAKEIEPDDTRWKKEEEEESQEEAEIAAAFAEVEPEADSPPRVQGDPSKSVSPPRPQAHFSPVPVDVSRVSFAPRPHPGPASTSGYVGAVSYAAAAAAYLQGLDSPLPLQLAGAPSSPGIRPLGSITAPVYSLQPRAGQPLVSSTTESTAPGTTKSTDVSQAADSNSPKPQVPVPPRKVQISVEDPYHADNDSDHEQRPSVSRAQKRKRSQSDGSNAEHPATPAKFPPTEKGKGKAKSPVRKIARKHCARRSTDTWRRAQIMNSTRSPSVASTVTSESSLVTLPSPSHISIPSSEPRPFLHAHSRRRGKGPKTMQEQLHKQRLPSAVGSRTGILRAEDVLTKAPTATPTSTTSPVTRSHCRYHRISIPKTENGPRISFLVPGCTLNDEDLIKEEEIEDHGEAIIQGDTLIVDDIETLDFEAYLHWVMRQLVGPEILRENEVFYLPQPGEAIVRSSKRPEKRKGGRPEKKRSKLTEETTANLTQNANTGQSASRDSSVASSASVLQQILEPGGLSDVTETEGERSPTKAGDKTASENGKLGLKGPSIPGENGSAVSRKRGRRLGQDAAAYQPTTESEDLTSTDFSDYNPNRRGNNRSRGQKRLRSEPNIGEGADGRKPKKLKTRGSQPLVQPGQSQSSAPAADSTQNPIRPVNVDSYQPPSSEAPSNVP